MLPRRASAPRGEGARLDKSSPHGRALRWLQSPKPKVYGGQEALGPAEATIWARFSQTGVVMRWVLGGPQVKGRHRW